MELLDRWLLLETASFSIFCARNAGFSGMTSTQGASVTWGMDSVRRWLSMSKLERESTSSPQNSTRTGALALGDIGSFFPDSDPLYKDADSMELLKQILAHDAFRNWTLVNADLSILAQKPKLAPHIGEMRQSLADALGVDCSRISVKAKTAEGLGDIGEGRAMEARAVVLLRRK